jgi:hypothetical protein
MFMWLSSHKREHLQLIALLLLKLLYLQWISFRVPLLLKIALKKILGIIDWCEVPSRLGSKNVLHNFGL